MVVVVVVVVYLCDSGGSGTPLRVMNSVTPLKPMATTIGRSLSRMGRVVWQGTGGGGVRFTSRRR